MPLTKDQLESRKGHLGASDVASLLGLDPRRSAYDLWAQATGRLEEKEDKGKPWLATGNRFESAMIDWAELILGPISRDASVPDPAGTILLAHPDGLVKATGNPVEAKTAGLYGPLQEHWGDEHTDDVPARVIVQATIQMLCTLKVICHIPAFIQSRGECMFVVPFDKDLANQLRDKAQAFWTLNVLADTPPTALPSIETITKLRREPATVVDVPNNLIDDWVMARELRLAASLDEKDKWQALAGALGTHEAARCSTGLVTYYQQHRVAYEVQACDFRVARYKAIK